MFDGEISVDFRLPCWMTRQQVVRHILNDLERFGAKPIDFKAFLDIMTAKMGERDTKEDWPTQKMMAGYGTYTNSIVLNL